MFSDFYPDIKTGITRRNMWDLVRHHKTQTVINNACNMISHHRTLLNLTYWGLRDYQHERLFSVMRYNDKSEISLSFPQRLATGNNCQGFKCHFNRRLMKDVISSELQSPQMMKTWWPGGAEQTQQGSFHRLWISPLNTVEPVLLGLLYKVIQLLITHYSLKT